MKRNVICLPVLPDEYAWWQDGERCEDNDRYSFDIRWREPRSTRNPREAGDLGALLAWTLFVDMRINESVHGKTSSYFCLDPQNPDKDSSVIVVEGDLQACVDTMAARAWLNIWI